MSLLVYPIFETTPLDARTDSSNCFYERGNLFSSDPFRTSAFSDFRIFSQSRISTYHWRNEYPSISSESSLSPFEHREPFELENINAYHKLWTPQELPSNRQSLSLNSSKCAGRSKTMELWRPFSPSPLDEICTPDNKNFVGNTGNHNGFSVIIPSPVKLEQSKTSLFKPVKKKKYNCPNCPSTYMNSTQLKSHMRKHKGVKPFKCEYPNCMKNFSRNEELSRHRRIHSGYKPYLCHVCSKSFCRKDHLSKHLKTHLQISEKKTYVCCVPGCEHRYTRSDALTRHKSTAHSIQKTNTIPKNKK
ncbi:krueppel-like factor 15 [Trichonephila clavipes]|nr:krueppel-like factor 15 [Trichonephila clavipes]